MTERRLTNWRRGPHHRPRSMRTYPLDKARADGWLEQLGQGSTGFAQLCEVVGTRFVGFSVIAGIRITALTVDPRNTSQSVVEFELEGFGGPQKLTLADFREHLADVVLADDFEPEIAPPTGRADSEELQTFIGFRYVLLAPLFDVRLDELRVDDDGQATVLVTREGTRAELTLEELREELRDHVQAEAERHRRPQTPFSIDLNLIPQAKKALAAGDAARTAELLGAWPSPLALLLRTAEGQSLAPEVRATLAEALGVLGSAYVELGRHEWAQEVLRLAIQWGQEQLQVSGDLFRRLGGAFVAQGRHGEAIGLLRRALGLGAPRAEVLPVLARCFLARKRYLAALLLAEDAIAAGASRESVSEVRDAASEVLGEHWARFRNRVPSSSGTR